MTTDWKQTLGAVLQQMPPEEHTEDTNTADTITASAGQNAASALKRPIMTLFFERRKGKPSTIICGYEQSCAESKALAAMLKQRLACGGSERDGEILLQGDVRERVRTLLRTEGYKVKG